MCPRRQERRSLAYLFPGAAALGTCKQFEASYTASSVCIFAKRSLSDQEPAGSYGWSFRYPARAQGFTKLPQACRGRARGDSPGPKTPRYALFLSLWPIPIWFVGTGVEKSQCSEVRKRMLRNMENGTEMEFVWEQGIRRCKPKNHRPMQCRLRSAEVGQCRLCSAMTAAACLGRPADRTAA